MTKDSSPPKTIAERASRLQAMRASKMAESAHAFVRARADLFYQVIAAHDRGFPVGPAVWISGDAHAENFGALPDMEGNVELLLNDFDESVIGNPALDVARLSLSLATAARSGGHAGRDVHGILTSVIDGYDAALARVVDPDAPKPETKSARLQALLRDASRQTRRDLLKRLTGDEHPKTLPIGERFWPLPAASRDALTAVVAQPPVRELAGGAAIEVLDVAFRIAGTASLGGFRAALLVSVGDAVKGERLRILDVKEAAKSAAPAQDGTPRDDAERALEGGRVLAPAYGARRRAVTVQSHRALARELMPQEKKAELDALTADELAPIAFTLGRVLGKAHGRQLTPKDAKAWRTELDAKRAPDRPPLWLSRIVATLVGAHESAYLEHCSEVGDE